MAASSSYVGSSGRRVGRSTVRTGETGLCVTAVVQKALQHSQIIPAERNQSWECGRQRRDRGVQVRPSLQQQRHGADAALTRRHQQRADRIQAQARTGVHQHFRCPPAAVGDGEVESGGAPVRVPDGAAVRQSGVYVCASFQQRGGRCVAVMLRCQVQRADPAVAQLGAACSGDQQGNNPENKTSQNQ